MIQSNFIIPIAEIEKTSNTIIYDFKIDPKSEVFKGHFPGSPIVPGVLELQTIEEILFQTLHITGRLNAASNIKFSTPLLPKEDQVLSCAIQYEYITENRMACKATIKSDDILYATSKCEFLVAKA